MTAPKLLPCREAFEAWFVKSNNLDADDMYLLKMSAGNYIWANAQGAWLAWQAALETRPQSGDDAKAEAIHYPECWDVAAYPNVESALAELYAWFKCSNDDCTIPDGFTLVPRQPTRHMINRVMGINYNHIPTEKHMALEIYKTMIESAPKPALTTRPDLSTQIAEVLDGLRIINPTVHGDLWNEALRKAKTVIAAMMKDRG